MVFYTIGTGGDYADVTASLAFMASFGAGGIPDDFTFTVLDNITDSTVGATYNIWSKQHSITFTSSSPVEVRFANLLRFKLVAGAATFLLRDKLTIENITFTGTGNSATLSLDGAANFASTYLFTVANCRFFGFNKANSCFGFPYNTVLLNCYNCVFYNWDRATQTHGGTSTGAITPAHNYSNCSFYNNNYCFYSNQSVHPINFTNTVFSDSIIADFFPLFAGTVRPTYINCADHDNTAIGDPLATATNCLTGVSSTVEFESLDPANQDFLKLKLIDANLRISGTPRTGPAPLNVRFNNNLEYSVAGKILPNGGIVPTFSSVDLAGKRYGEFGFYPIGCYNAQLKAFGDVWEL